MQIANLSNNSISKIRKLSAHLNLESLNLNGKNIMINIKWYILIYSSVPIMNQRILISDVLIPNDIYTCYIADPDHIWKIQEMRLAVFQGLTSAQGN